jgi:hypothetical protein
MKKILFTVLVAIFLFNFFIILVMTQSSETLEIPEGFAFYRYQYAFLDISLIYPDDWVNHSSQERGIMIYTPNSKGVLLLIATPLFGEEYTLEELWSINMENLESAGAVFQESIPDTLSGYPAIKVLHTIKLGNDSHQYIRYSSIIGDMFYTFSFHAPVGDFKDYLEEVMLLV